MVNIRSLGHAAFALAYESKIIYIDPFIKNNPRCPISVEDITKADIVCVTHGHYDHLGSTEDIIKQTGAVLVSAPEIIHYMKRLMPDIKNEPLGCGGSVEIDGIKIRAVEAKHSNAIHGKGEFFPVGIAYGFIIEFGQTVIYHAGDTAVFSDMKLIAELYMPKVAMLPIGDRYTMGPREASVAASFIGAEIIIPMHYGTFPLIGSEVEKFTELTKETAPASRVVVVNPGESIDVE